jgi:hypothetical protein
MKVRLRWFWLVLVSLSVTALGVRSTYAQSENRRYFSETGHWVTGEFLTAYESVPDYALLYGYPLTEAFQSKSLGIRVQYFERARFELRPENPAELRVELSPLGKYLYDHDKPGPVVSSAKGSPGCRFFTEARFQVCYAFLDYFDAYGGIDQFGFPISNLETHDGFTVQYFQRARFEWHPELPSGQRVVLTDVGRRYFHLFEDQRLAVPLSDGAPHVVLDLQVQAFLDRPVMTVNGDQIIYVIVQDQSLSPVAGAQVTFGLHLPTDPPDKETLYLVGATNEMGIAQLAFPVRGQPYGIVDIRVTAIYENLKKQTITSYRVWW